MQMAESATVERREIVRPPVKIEEIYDVVQPDAIHQVAGDPGNHAPNAIL